MKQIEISDNDSGQRLDKYLLKYFNKATKSFIYKMLRKKRIKLNGGKAEGNEMLSDGDTIQMYLSEETMESFMAVSYTHLQCKVCYGKDHRKI